MGQEPRMGRWGREPKARNGLLVHRLEVAEAQLAWTQPSTLKCVKLYDSAKGGQVLMHLNEVHVPAGLMQVLAGAARRGVH